MGLVKRKHIRKHLRRSNSWRPNRAVRFSFWRAKVALSERGKLRQSHSSLYDSLWHGDRHKHVDILMYVSCDPVL